MIMPPPQQPPGLYGPPQPPNPYAQQPQPQQQYQQFPAQQPYPGYPGHQGQPYPGQGPWGQPPMGPPPRKNPAGKIIGAIGGAFALVIGLLVLSWFGNRGSDARSSAEPFPAAEYKLVLPKTLLDSDYKLVTDGSEETNAEAKEEGYGEGSDMRNVKGVVASYSGTDDQDVLVISGVHGQFKDPVAARTSLLDGLRKTDGMSEPNAPRGIKPPGSDVDLTCNAMLSKDRGVTSTFTYCAWGDENTAAYVLLLNVENSQQDPDSVDLDKTAETTVRVRDEVRKPIA